MVTKPRWLPEIISVDGEWKEVLKRLYAVFEHDFKRGRPKLNEFEVWWDHRKREETGYEEGFHHLIEREERVTMERLFDPRRAERLPWAAPTINNSNDAEVKVWDYKEANGKTNTYVWLHQWDYVIILQKRAMRVGPVVFVVTAFHVDGDSKRRNLWRKWEEKTA
jgi:hypothetical protein